MEEHRGSRRVEKAKDGRKEEAKDGRKEAKAKEDLDLVVRAKAEEYTTLTCGGVQEEPMTGTGGTVGMTDRCDR